MKYEYMYSRHPINSNNRKAKVQFILLLYPSPLTFIIHTSPHGRSQDFISGGEGYFDLFTITIDKHIYLSDNNKVKEYFSQRIGTKT